MESISEEKQLVWCDNCGHQLLVPILKIRHATKGSGAGYKIQGLHNDHQFAMKALFELDALDIYKRKSLKEISKKFHELAGHYPVRNTVGGRLSELANVELQFVAYYSPRSAEKIDDNPSFRNSKLAGWYLKEHGIEYCWHRLDYANGEFVKIQEAEFLDQFSIGKVVWENGRKSDRMIPVERGIAKT